MKRECVRKNHPIVQKKIKKSLSLSIREGGASAAASNLSLSYFSAAALAMSATSAQIGILYSIANFLPSIVQLKSADLIRRFSRKGIVISSIIGKILIVLPLILIGYLHWVGVPYMIWGFIALVGLHYIFTAIARPAWFSWMGNLVPEEKRGSYFSQRNRIVGIFGVISMIGGAIILDWMKRMGNFYGDVLGLSLMGFGILFFASAIIRFYSWGAIKKTYEPKLKLRKKDSFSLLDFLKSCPNTPFGKFSIFAGVFSFVVGISAPYWTVYMLRDLGFSYIWFMAVNVSVIIFQLIFLPLLGKFGDRFGNIRLIRTCSLLMGVTPFIWIASSLIENSLAIRIYLLLLPSIVGGFARAGYNLALNNYVYDAVSNNKRGLGLSYMNFFVGFGNFVGAGLGAFLAWLNVSFMHPLFFIFMISGIGRFIVVLYGSKFLHEVRNVKKYPGNFWTRELAPTQGILREFHDFEHLVDRVEHFVTDKDKKEFRE